VYCFIGNFKFIVSYIFSLITSWNKRDEEQRIDRTSYTGTYVVDAHGPRYASLTSVTLNNIKIAVLCYALSHQVRGCKEID